MYNKNTILSHHILVISFLKQKYIKILIIKYVTADVIIFKKNY
jgi:hypothetical protein